jgi:hypothetical protein
MFRPATRSERFAHWFDSGSGGSPDWYCRTCGAPWSDGSGYLFFSPGPRWRKRVRLPLDLLDALRGARTWHPVPRFYAIVGAAALPPAAAVAASTQVRWRVTMVGAPLAAIGGAFLWSLTSGRGHWRREVLQRLAPERAWSQERVETIAAMREQVGGFRLLAPEGWPGALTLQAGSWSVPPRGRKVLHEVTVVADQGDPLLDPDHHTLGWRPARPRMEVHVSLDPRPLEEMAVDRLLDDGFPPPATPDLEGLEVDRQEATQRLRAWHKEADHERQRREAELVDRWHEGTVSVDGFTVPARLLTHDETDVGVAWFDLEGDGVLVVAEGIDLDAIRLAGVADPEPLIHEFEVRQRRAFPGATA